MAETDIAIIGMQCRFPGAASVDEYWTNLRNGVETIRRFTPEELMDGGVDPELLKRSDYVTAGPVVDGIDLFDARFFGYNAREAELMDPQQRLFLETAHAALENAGYAPCHVPGTVGVYGGCAASTYMLHCILPERERLDPVAFYQAVSLNDKDFLTSKAAYKLNLTGPAINVQTGCSTSLVAVHLACQALLSGECDLALAGGVAISVPQSRGYLYQEGMIFSPDGHCRPFDAKAQGTLGGNGVGLVVLKRLEDALAQRDHIHAVIKGSAVNNDGALKVGYMAPGVEGQTAVIREALAVAGIDPATVTYVETHGTATPLGDSIEIAALNRAFHQHAVGKHTCAIGSVKSNFGHLDVAAGIAGLIKTVLAISNGEIPASLHFTTAPPEIDFDAGPFFVNTRLAPWPGIDGVRRAGVSSFGIGGTNAHLVLEQAPPVTSASGTDMPQLLIVSARQDDELRRAVADLGRHLTLHPEISLADVAYTLQVGREEHACRCAFVCTDRTEAIRLLATGGTLGSVTCPGWPEEGDETTVSLPTSEKAQASAELLTAVGRQWCAGAAIDWQRFSPAAGPRRIPLPTYPFSRQRYWFGPSSRTRGEAQETSRKPLQDWFYLPTWKRCVLPVAPPDSQPWLLFGEKTPFLEALEEELRQGGGKVLRISSAPEFRVEGPTSYGIRPQAREDYARLFSHLAAAKPPMSRMVHLWSLPATTYLGNHELPGERHASIFTSLLHVAATCKPLLRPAASLIAVGCGLHDVTGNEHLDPAASQLMAAIRVIPQEIPGLSCRSIDLEATQVGDSAALLARELRRQSSTAAIALRGGHPWSEEFQPYALAAAEGEHSLRKGATCLLIGGLGRLGLILAEHLAVTRQANLVLLSPSAETVPSGKQDRLQRIRERAGSLELVAADAADAPALDAALAGIESRFGGIDAIFYLAGVTDSRSLAPLAACDSSLLTRHFRAKVNGVQALARAMRERRIGCCIVFSSLAAQLGGVGFAAYSAASQVLDAYVHEQNRKGDVPWLSISWDGWTTGDKEDPANQLIRPQEGMEALERILAVRPADQVLVSTRDLDLRLRENRQAQEPVAVEESLASTRHERPELAVAYSRPEGSVEETVAQVWKKFLGLADIGRSDDFFELGGHSLLAIQVVTHLNSLFRTNLPVHILFEAPTVEMLALHLTEQLAATTEEMSNLAQMLDLVEGLSEEELQAILDTKEKNG